MGELAKIDTFRKEIAIVETIEEVKILSTKGELMAKMAEKLKIPLRGQNELGKTRVILEKKKRELIEQMFPKGGKRGNQYKKVAKSEITTLANVGITRDESSDAKIIKEEEALVNEVMEEIEKSGAVIEPKKVAHNVRKKKKEEKRKKLAEEGSKKEINVDFRLGDFEEVLADIPDNSVDCIITDPPYPYEYIECWSKLSKFAAKKLKNNGFCIAYSGQMYLPEVMKRMGENLDYYWTFSLLHTGSKQLINARNVFCGWKPILIFQKGFKKSEISIDDIITGSGREKEQHKWQQAVDELKPIIETFTKPGDLIIDPFAGSATTIIAAKKLNRSIIATEIEEETYYIAKNRINGIFG